MSKNLSGKSERKADARSYHRTQMQKEMIIQKLKEEGCRITKQRLMLLDIILEEDCFRCKEIYYKSLKTGWEDWFCHGIPHGKYVGRNRRDQQEKYV